jgi:hypothetical protein
VEVAVGEGVSVGEGVNVGGMPVEVEVALDAGGNPFSDGPAERAKANPSPYAEGFGFRSPEAQATIKSAKTGIDNWIRDKTRRPFISQLCPIFQFKVISARAVDN